MRTWTCSRSASGYRAADQDLAVSLCSLHWTTMEYTRRRKGGQLLPPRTLPHRGWCPLRPVPPLYPMLPEVEAVLRAKKKKKAHYAVFWT